MKVDWDYLRAFLLKEIKEPIGDEEAAKYHDHGSYLVGQGVVLCPPNLENKVSYSTVADWIEFVELLRSAALWARIRPVIEKVENSGVLVTPFDVLKWMKTAHP